MVSIQTKVAIYTRVSTPGQAEEGYSIDEQEKLLTDYCIRNGYEVVRCYSDKGVSGKNIENRPEMKRLLSDAKEGKFDMVISWKINRMSRTLEDVIKIIDMLEKHNVTYKSYSESFDTTTPAGKMQFQMMAMIGEFERSTIAENVKMGMTAKAKSGEWCGGSVLGYDLARDESSEKGKNKLVINQKEAVIVRFIFNEYSKGRGYKTITNEMNNLGYKTKKGNFFSVGPIRDILNNPVYIGKIRYNLHRNCNDKRRKSINPNPLIVDGKHEAIIDIDTWNRVQALLQEKKGKAPRVYDGEYPLTGILKCLVCGAGMVISRNGKRKKDGMKVAYYACGAWKNQGTAVCHSNAIRADKANEYVFDRLSELLSNDRMIKDIVDNINRERKKKTQPNKQLIVKVEREITKLERRKKKIFEGYEDDILTKEEFFTRKEELNKELDILVKERENYNKSLDGTGCEEI